MSILAGNPALHFLAKYQRKEFTRGVNLILFRLTCWHLMLISGDMHEVMRLLDLICSCLNWSLSLNSICASEMNRFFSARMNAKYHAMSDSLLSTSLIKSNLMTNVFASLFLFGCQGKLNAKIAIIVLKISWVPCNGIDSVFRILLYWS